ncbi:hypothetical protein GUJ93_ZPchr0012g18930 [Zizania palustris]|uniref:Uncharacterized protein n=1 Tax=Zizania palustris TaxID=103762 RepID=A0A8J5WR89_ZIZPA|nr:hypothetical protein GUJ93_ZPchr0012g18930 [Zizania palustris]
MVSSGTACSKGNLDKNEDDLMKTDLTLNDFKGESSEAKGILSLELMVGHKMLPTVFFVVDVQEDSVIGVVLTQEVEGKEYIIMFLSHRLLDVRRGHIANDLWRFIGDKVFTIIIIKDSCIVPIINSACQQAGCFLVLIVSMTCSDTPVYSGCASNSRHGTSYWNAKEANSSISDATEAAATTIASMLHKVGKIGIGAIADAALQDDAE